MPDKTESVRDGVCEVDGDPKTDRGVDGSRPPLRKQQQRKAGDQNDAIDVEKGQRFPAENVRFVPKFGKPERRRAAPRERFSARSRAPTSAQQQARDSLFVLPQRRTVGAGDAEAFRSRHKRKEAECDRAREELGPIDCRTRSLF